MKNFKLVMFLIIINNFSASQHKCRDFKNSDDYVFDQIYLLESNDPQHSVINEQFVSENSGYPQTLVTECQLKVEDIIEYSKQFPYFINLYVPDFYENNYNKVKESLVFAGDIDGFETKVDVCKSARKREDEIEICEHFIDAGNKHVKLITNQILEDNFKEIYIKVLEFQPNNENPRIPMNLPVKKQLNVIVCDKTIIDSYYYDSFNINPDNCNDDDPTFLESVKTDTLAVLAPKVFNIIRPIDNPVLFYGDPYITKETKDWFENSVTAVPWQLLKYGFLFLIKNMKWMRVAIISDSSEYSQEFKAVLTMLLRENGIAYMTETCVTSNCGEVIDKINGNSAKIIIANFDLDKMRKIAPYAKSKKPRARNLIWVTRDWRKKEAKEAADLLSSEIFNISFKKNLTYILQILSKTLSRIHVNCDTEPCSFSKSEAATQLKQFLKTSKIMLTKLTRNNNNRYVQSNIGYIVIENDKITEEHFNYTYPIEDSFISCIFWNNRFEKPCNDIELVLLMVVLSVFFLTVLGVVLFFQSPELETSYKRIL